MNGNGSGFWAGEYGQYEEGQDVSPSRAMVIYDIPEYGLGEEELASQFGRSQDEGDIDFEDTMAEEEARRQWEKEYKDGGTKESWGDRWERFKKERQEGASKRAVKAAEKARKKALKLREEVALARLESIKRQYGGTKIQKAKRLLKEFEFGSKPSSMKMSASGYVPKMKKEMYTPTSMQRLTTPPQAQRGSGTDMRSLSAPRMSVSLVQPQLGGLKRPQLGMGQLSSKVLPPAKLAKRPSVRKKGVI